MESRTRGSRPRTQEIRGQGQGQPFRGQTLSRPRTGTLEAKDQGQRGKCSPKKKSLQKFVSGEKGLKLFSFRRSPIEENKKRSSQIFRKVSGVFQQNFNGSKIVLSSSRGQGNFRELEASRPRPSKCVLEDVLDAKDVLKDFTSGKQDLFLVVRNLTFL